MLLVGDWAQLSAVQAGGAFSMLVRDRDLAPELTDVRRFRHRWEKTASIQLRVGDTDAIAAYTTRGRVESGTRDDLLDSLYAAWKTDVDAGLSSLMIAADTDTVSELNRRARADRVAAGQVAEHGLDVADGSVAGVGDRVVTRHNDRHLTTGRRWVKNGDAWIVTAVGHDGSMTVRRERGRGEVVLPAAYVREHVELGYASTAHRAQGRTVDTAHAMVSATTTREVLYVAATRGRGSNRLYVDTYYDPDHDTSHGPVQPRPAEDVLAVALGNVGADISAHATLANEMRTAESIPTLAAEYLTIARAAQAARWDALIDRSGLTTEQAEQVRDSEAYGPLAAAFRNAEARGLNIEAALPGIVAGRTLNGAQDIAATLRERVTNWTRANSHGPRQATTRLVAGIIPEALGVTDPDYQRALTERADAMNRRAHTLAEQAVAASAAWTRPLGPPPADPARHAAWLHEIATIAAYRERWSVTSRDPIAADRASIEKTGHEKRAAGGSRTRRPPCWSHHYDNTDGRSAGTARRSERNPAMSRRKQRRAMAAWASHARETSRHAARELALTIVRGQPSAMQAYDLGIVLNDGETAWQRAPADYWYRGERSWMVQHNSYRGFRSTINEVHQPCMCYAGMLDWLITNQRLAARQPDGQVISIYWSAIEAISVDLAREIVVLDGADGYHGELAARRSPRSQSPPSPPAMGRRHSSTTPHSSRCAHVQ